MSFKNTKSLGDALLRLQLVEQKQLTECIDEAGGPGASPRTVLHVLERKHYLTPYQIGKLKKGETDGLVLGEYKLMYQNASGSFARVFRACSVRDGKMIGLKILRQRWANDPEAVEQFRREAELCKKLKHKNIVPIYDVNSDGDYHFFTMEFIEGGNLRDFIRIRKKLSPVEATRFALDMAEGLEYALSKGLTHRDFKMTNVLMSIDGVARLVDFGLAGNEVSGSADSESVQRALEYVTLEKGTGAPLHDSRSDLFFLGAVYYELLTGQPAYPPTKSREERKMLSRYTNIKPIREVDPDIPERVIAIVERLMRSNPNERYQNPTEVVLELRMALLELGDDSVADAIEKKIESKPDEKESLPTVMCIEARPKQQNLLREYLTKHGFRVLVLTDLERALTRVKNNPPDCVVLMAESISSNQEIISGFDRAIELGRPAEVVSIIVLSEKQADLESQLKESNYASVMNLPITLRDLRKQIHLAFQRRKRNK